MACTQNPIEEQSAIRTDAPETIKVGFEDGETRIQLNSAQKTVWTKNDLVSVFYKSNANQKWEYRGETGERIASLYRVDDGSASRDMDYVVLAYPYSSDYVISTTTGNIEAKLPTTQYYAEGSYGVGSNLMVSRSEFTQFSLKSVCGWLKLQLTGNGEVIKSIKFRGNDDEQVAGLIYVDTETAEATLAAEMGGSDDNNAGGNLIFDDTVVTEVTLDCGEGVTLGAEATSFYIALPPQTFENGFTVVVECDNHKPMILSTSNALTIERNTIQPMASVKVELESIVPKPANNEIWYTNDSITEATAPYKTNVFGANIVSNTYDAEKECWVIKFDGEVTTIGGSAFYYCSSLTSVTIPDSVTTIGGAAFSNCWRLTSITIPGSVTTIGNYAFSDCRSLTSITIPDSVTKIGDGAFSDCSSLTSVTIPDSVTTIGEKAFYSCSSLPIIDNIRYADTYLIEAVDKTMSVYTIKENTRFIGEYAFEDCSSLTSVTIGDSVTTIGENAFSGCSSLTSITIPDSLTTIGKYAFEDCSSLTNVTIGDRVTTIGEKAFYSCSSLTSVTIPDSVTEIGWAAFHGCGNLPVIDNIRYADTYLVEAVDKSQTSYTIKESTRFIREYAFENCSSLTSVTIPDSVTTIGESAFWNCSSLTSVTIPDSVTKIGDSAFDDCSSLTSVTIGDSVTTIGESAFGGCSSLTSVTIPDSVTEIGISTFAGCDSLTSVTIGDSVTTIGKYAFSDCRSLTSITIPDSVTKIGNYAFYYCISLKSVYCKATTPPAGGSSMFSGNASGRKIYVPMESVGAYKAASYWCDYMSYIVGYDF